MNWQLHGVMLAENDGSKSLFTTLSAQEYASHIY